MGFSNHFKVQFKVTPDPDPGSKISVKLDYVPLLKTGLNFPVELSTARVFLKPPGSAKMSSIVVIGHFDTGASSTTIDISLAKHLNLIPVGESIMQTAGGTQTTPDFYINMSFPGSNLHPFHNLKIGSCSLPFDLNNGLDPNNFGILIGRDVMSRWNIVWNGPSSTVFIND